LVTTYLLTSSHLVPPQEGDEAGSLQGAADTNPDADDPDIVNESESSSEEEEEERQE
jgi:hypothetical protein